MALAPHQRDGQLPRCGDSLKLLNSWIESQAYSMTCASSLQFFKTRWQLAILGIVSTLRPYHDDPIVTRFSMGAMTHVQTHSSRVMPAMFNFASARVGLGLAPVLCFHGWVNE